MKALFFSFALSFCVGHSINAQETVSLVSYWNKGDLFTYKVTKIKQKYSEGVLQSNDSNSYIATFDVLDSSAEGYKIKWSYVNQISGMGGLPKELSNALNQNMSFNAIYTTTNVGEFKEVENWKEISDQITSSTQQMLDVLLEKDPSVDKAAFEKIMAPLLNAYTTKAGVEQLVLNELQYLHYGFGLEYAVNEEIKYEEAFPNMLGGDPIKGEGLLYVEGVDKEHQIFTLRNKTSIDQKEMKSVFEQVFTQMGLKDKELDKLLKKSKYDLKNNNLFVYDYYYGVPIQITTLRTLDMNMGKESSQRIDKVRIELKR